MQSLISIVPLYWFSCQEMAPEFERLAMDWQGHEIGLVAEVDCEGIDSEKICDDFEIEALPTILYGDLKNLKFYGGDRTYQAMSAFAKEHISHPVSEENRQRIV
jgi:thiol-disulfide isomerase/thioredoxin